MAALAAVARGDDGLAPFPPGRDHALDRLRGEIGPVGEHDHGCLRIQSRKAAAEGRARASLPLGAVDDARVGLDVVGADDDDNLVYRGTPEALQHLREKETLLGGAESSCGSGCEDDCG